MSHKFNPTAITCLIFLIAATQATAAFNDYSMLFDGVDGYVNVGNDSSLDGTTALTVSVWIYPITIDSADHMLFSKMNFTAPYKGWHARISSANKIRFGFATDDGKYRYADTSVLTSNNWHLFVGVWNGTNAVTYLNGNVDSTPIENGTLGEISNTVALTIGYGIGNTYFNGFIDEASLWDKALSSNEVSELYNSGYPGNLANHSAQTNLVSWWRMGDGGTWDGTNWSIPDLKGINTGISTNMEYSDRSQEVPPAPIPSGTMFMAR